MAHIVDYKSRVQEVEQGFKPVYARMKEDEDMLNLKKYVMTDSSSKPQPIPNIVNVTLNMPSYMATNILTDIGSASEQIVVTSHLATFDTHSVEEFISTAFMSANERLRFQGMIDMNSFTDGQNCIRGRSARRVFCQIGQDGIPIIDITPWDTRYVSYELDTDGLVWAAYHFKKSKGQIFAQYGLTSPDDESEVYDIYSRYHIETWVGGQKVREIIHDSGCVPVVIETVTLGSGGYLLTPDSKSAEGESIFFMIRDVIPELNRLASIMQTLNLKSVKPPTQYQNKEGGKATPPAYEDAMGLGSMTSTELGGGLVPVNYGDAQRSAQLAFTMMQTAFEAGGMTSTELGLLGKPPASGIALLIAGEGRERIFHPRLIAKSNLNKATAKMVIKQLQAKYGGGAIQLGEKGYEQKFNLDKLDGTYTIDFNYSIRSQEVDAGRASLAAAYGNLISNRTKRAEILQRDDPEGDEDLLRMEAAEMISPMVRKYRSIKSLKKLGHDFEAEMMSAEFGVELDVLLGGQPPEVKPPTPSQPKQVLSLFGGASGRPSGGNANPDVGRSEEEQAIA